MHIAGSLQLLQCYYGVVSPGQPLQEQGGRTQAHLLYDTALQGYAELLRRLNRPGAVVLPAFETADNGTEGQQLALAAVHSE